MYQCKRIKYKMLNVTEKCKWHAKNVNDKWLFHLENINGVSKTVNGINN